MAIVTSDTQLLTSQICMRASAQTLAFNGGSWPGAVVDESSFRPKADVAGLRKQSVNVELEP